MTALFLIIAARFFMAAVNRRKALVYGLVLLAALGATVVDYLTLRAVVTQAYSGCEGTVTAAALYRAGESALKSLPGICKQTLRPMPKMMTLRTLRFGQKGARSVTSGVSSIRLLIWQRFIVV